jgi:hypothetical protein
VNRHSDAFLDLLVLRCGEFDKALPPSERPLLREEMTSQFKDSWRQYVEDQLLPDVYGGEDEVEGGGRDGGGGGGGGGGGDGGGGDGGFGGGLEDAVEDEGEGEGGGEESAGSRGAGGGASRMPQFQPKQHNAANFSLEEALALCSRTR